MLWRIGNDLPLPFRCHTGHAFSALPLESQQRDGAENALRSAARHLQESLLLAEARVSRAESARNPEASELRARKERLRAAIDTTLQLELEPST